MQQTNTRRRHPYPSDISDAQWRSIAPTVPPERDLGRHRSTDVREIVNGINYRWSTGCVWRMLPHDFPPWGTVYTYFHRWQQDGTLKELRDALAAARIERRAPSRTATTDDNSPVSDQYPVPVA
jgi:transposase